MRISLTLVRGEKSSKSQHAQNRRLSCKGFFIVQKVKRMKMQTTAEHSPLVPDCSAPMYSKSPLVLLRFHSPFQIC